jgi:hypothetical protein
MRERTSAGHAREARWQASDHRPLWADSFRLTLVVFVLIAAVCLGFAWHFGHQADSIGKLFPCTAGGSTDCIRTERGVLVARKVDRTQQSVVVLFADGPRTIYLSSDGWGGRWRGHFPVGERVTVEYNGKTPLGVIDSDGHHRNTSDNPSESSNFLWFMGFIFLGCALPAALFFRMLQRRRAEAALA